MSSDPGSTHYVGDGCQPAHDPRIDQPDDVSEHYDARVVAEAYRRASTGTGPVSFEELHAEYLAEIDAKVRAEKEDLYDVMTARAERAEAEIERLTVELTHRVGWEERCLDAEAALATLRAENVWLRAVLDEIAAEDDE
jgi:predicted nucleotidyltransferase component of viral defense system